MMMMRETTMTILAAAALAFAPPADAKRDPVAASIAQARAAGAAAPAADESAELKEILGDAKLVAKADEAGRAASAIMAGGEDRAAPLDAAAGPGAGSEPETGLGPEAVAPSAAGGETADVAASPAAAAKPDVSKMSEKDIPVLAAKPKKAKADTTTAARVIASAGVLLLLAASVAWGLRKYTKRDSAKGAATKIRILTQHHLGPKRSIAIVQVAGESILVGITDHSITMLKTLSLLDEEIPDATPKDFNAALDDYDFDGGGGGARVPRGQEDFAMRGLSDIRDSVSRRLKGLKQI